MDFANVKSPDVNSTTPLQNEQRQPSTFIGQYIYAPADHVSTKSVATPEVKQHLLRKFYVMRVSDNSHIYFVTV